jgi:hypothetical protein
MACSRMGQILPEASRAYVEERLFRAASARAFNCGLQPRPALKGIHPPAVAAMNGRSSTLTQALVLRTRRNIRRRRNTGAARVRGTPPLCLQHRESSLSLCRFRKRWASPAISSKRLISRSAFPCAAVATRSMWPSPRAFCSSRCRANSEGRERWTPGSQGLMMM